MRRLLLVLLLAAIGAGLLLSACGSGEDVQPTGTEISPREARQATVLQEQEREPQETAQPVDQQARDGAAQAESADQGQEQQAINLPPDEIGEHKGVRSQRNLLGEPDAPVLIEYYGDFT